MKLNELTTSELRVQCLKDKLYELGLFTEDKTTDDNITMEHIKSDIDCFESFGVKGELKKTYILRLKSADFEDNCLNISYIADTEEQGRLLIVCDSGEYALETTIVDVYLTEDNQIKVVLEDSLDGFLDSLKDDDCCYDPEEYQNFTKECFLTIEKVEVSIVSEKLDLFL